MIEERKKKFLQAFYELYGIIQPACEKSGVSRTTFFRWQKEDAEFAEKVAEIREAQKDFVESKLIKNIDAGDTTAILFYLKTQAKDRGYNEKAISAPAVSPSTTLAIEAKVTGRGEKMKKLIASEKRRIIKSLKAEGKYSSELYAQIDIAASSLAEVADLRDIVFSDDYQPILTEISREGNTRQIVNANTTKYHEAMTAARLNLRALGMNFDARERKVGDDGFNDFMNEFKSE